MHPGAVGYAAAMSDERLKLPPFRALMAFWAAATSDRLADAASVLGVTESAVSHQLKSLEAALNAKLFDRSSGRLSLTPIGQRYLARIEPALREIQAATDAILPASGRQVVRLTLPPSLAATWLLPMLGRFEAAFPDIDVQLVLTTRIVDLVRDHVDLAVRYGKGAWPGTHSDFLFADRATPIAAPGYLPEGVDLDAIPVGKRLILNRAIPAEWEEWARARGLPPPDLSDALEVDSIEQSLQIAETGHGMAMGRAPYIETRLAAGTLVAPFGAAGPTGAAYYLCHSDRQPMTAVSRRLHRWLREQVSAPEVTSRMT
ncbi:MAG: LysR substrate-binding domain-containing protein [Pseudomonadota bacterium]